jgi:thiamine pyrophosphokinase
MSEKTAYITGAGAFTTRGFYPGRCDIVIAADGGYEALSRHGIRPNMVLGDMDSIKGLPKGVTRLRFPARKDETDIALGIKLLESRGCRRFKLYGALGGRMDHSLANFHLLAGLAQRGLKGLIVAPDLTAWSLSSATIALPPLPRGTLLSVFAWGGPAKGVSLKGLKYPLSDADLSPYEPLGISNEALGGGIEVSVRNGTLLITALHGNPQV